MLDRVIEAQGGARESCRDGRVSYFYGTLPVFTHDEKDVKTFRLFTSQLYLEGKVKQADLVKVFDRSSTVWNAGHLIMNSLRRRRIIGPARQFVRPARPSSGW